MATNPHINVSVHRVRGFAAIVDTKSLAADAGDISQIKDRKVVPAGTFRIKAILEDGSIGPELTFFVPTPEIAEAYAEAINDCSTRLRQNAILAGSRERA